jgi:aryl-alcohol dehydrogenase-like predicted oxidoreductase
MRYVDLPVASPGPRSKVSVLGFGCAPLMGRVGRRDSLRALSAALDAGITFFDTARSYGYGQGEALLGEVLQGRRDSVVVCTKFGILPANKGTWKQRLKPAAQAAIRIFPGLRKFARRHAGDQFQPGQFSVEVLRSSLEESLRALKTDYVDMLLLHAAPVEVLDDDDLLLAMQRLVESGKVRMAGISGEQSVIAETFRRRPSVLTTAQFAMNSTNLDFARQTTRPEAQERFLVANHPFGGPEGVAATSARIAAMQSSAALPAELREKIKANDPQRMPEILLNVILEGTGISAVVPAMMRPASLRSNLLAIDHCRFTPEEIHQLREELMRQTSSEGDRRAAGSTP